MLRTPDSLTASRAPSHGLGCGRSVRRKGPAVTTDPTAGFVPSLLPRVTVGRRVGEADGLSPHPRLCVIPSDKSPRITHSLRVFGPHRARRERGDQAPPRGARCAECRQSQGLHPSDFRHLYGLTRLARCQPLQVFGVALSRDSCHALLDTARTSTPGHQALVSGQVQQ